MKKILSFLVVIALIFGTSFTVSSASGKIAAAKEVESTLRTGMIKNFTSNTVTIYDSGKTYTLPFAKNVKVIKQGLEVNFLETVKKGLTVQYKAMLRDGVPVSLTYIDISPAGSVFEGVIGASLSYEENTVFDYEDKAVAKVSKNSNNMIEANSLSSSEFTTDSTAYEIQPNGKDLFIGAYVIIPESIKLSLDGKEIKVIDGTVEFDAANSSDEAKLTKDSKLQYTISLETPLTNDQIANIGKVIKLSYQIKEYNVQRLELTNLLVNENAYIELNGKEVSLAKAMYRANYAIAETNDRSEVVYINAFYKDLTCTVDSISGNKINVTAVKNGYPAFKETLILDAGCIFTDSTGNAISASDIKVNDRILVTTSPDLQYNVVTVIKVQ